MCCTLTRLCSKKRGSPLWVPDPSSNRNTNMLLGFWLSNTDSTLHDPRPFGVLLPNKPGAGADGNPFVVRRPAQQRTKNVVAIKELHGMLLLSVSAECALTHTTAQQCTVCRVSCVAPCSVSVAAPRYHHRGRALYPGARLNVQLLRTHARHYAACGR